MQNRVSKSSLLGIVFMALLGWGRLQAQVPGYLPTTGLVACYTLDGNANDVSGHGLNGIATAVTPTTDRFFHPGSASFFSPGSHVDCGNDSLLDLDECTIAAWVRITQLTFPVQTIVAKADADTNGVFAMQIAEDRFRTLFFLDSTAVQLDCFVPSLALSQWYHLVVTHHPSWGVSMYINGNLVQSSPISGSLRAGTAGHHLRIGAMGQSLQDPIQGGKLDDVALWNVAIGTEDIEAMYQQGVVALEAREPGFQLSIDPNPASSSIRLSVGKELIGEEYQILDGLGRRMLTGILSAEQTSLSVTEWPAGIYLLQTKNGAAQKFIVL